MTPFLLVLLALFGGGLQEQDPGADRRAALDEARRRASELGEPTDDEGKAWKAAYDERIRLLEESLRTQEQSATVVDEATLEERRGTAQSALDELGDVLPTSVALENADDLAEFQRAAVAAETERVRAQTRLDSLRSRKSEAEAELAGISARGEAIAQRQQVADSSDVGAYHSESARLEQEVVTQRTELVPRALGIWAAELPVAELELRLAEAQAEFAQRRLELATERATELREAQAAAERQRAAAQARQAARESDPIQRLRGNLGAEAGELRSRITADATTSAELRRVVEAETEAMSRLELDRVALDQRLELQPLSADATLRRTLERIRQTDRVLEDTTLPRLYEDLQANQEELAEVLDRIWVVSLPLNENPIFQGLLDELDPSRHDEAWAVVSEGPQDVGLLDTLRERRTQLESANEAYSELLERLTARDTANSEFEEYVLGRMLWTRSDSPIDGALLVDAWHELTSVPRRYRDAGAWRGLGERVTSRIPLILLGAAAVGALQLLLVRTRAYLARSYGPEAKSLRVVSARLLKAVLPPAQIAIVAWATHTLGPPDAFDPPFVTLLCYQALFVMLRRVGTALLERDGILVRLGATTPEVGVQLMRSLGLATWGGQLLYAPYLVLSDSPFNFESLPRLFFTPWAALVCIAILLLFMRRGALVQRWTSPSGVVRSLVTTVGWLGIGTAPIALVLDALGYRVGAGRSFQNGLRIASAVAVLAVIHRTLEYLGQRAAERILRKSEGKEDPDLKARADAVRVVSRISALLLVVVAVVLLIQLWDIGDAGYQLLSTYQVFELENGEWLTGWDIYTGLMWIVLGHLVVHNLSRLYSILVEPFVGPGQRGTRYAIFTIIRYVLLALAYLIALTQLKFSFAAIGWFATAASVGLGFGLQEIVANFISGLILLFERPVRVGDIVSIGNTSGTVEKITMRATVITNWERQTMIVPNKKFVTENLTNWTHSDEVMRRKLTVRVAYGTNVERVLQLLDQIVGSHPSVVEDPPHRIWFEEFGEFGLEFQIWFYGKISDGLRTRSDLHAVIDARFREEGIDMPVISGELAHLLHREDESDAQPRPQP